MGGGCMEAIAEFLEPLQDYLQQLDGLAQRWRQWLDDNQRAILAGDLQRLDGIQRTGGALLSDADALAESREWILRRAAEQGVAAANLKMLVRNLGRKCPMALRGRLQRVELEIQHLRRAHAATWILANQLYQHASGTLRLITAGVVETPVYNQPVDCETGGGVLDTDA